jgi:hypothetical protein
MAYTKYSLTPADNNAAPPNGAPEGMLPSAVNDTMRDMMAQIRDVGDGIRGGTYTMTAPVITGGSITGVALTGNTFTNPIITGAAISTSTLTGNTFTNPVISGGSINNTPIGASTASTGAFSTLSVTGATTFSGATVANTFSSSGATITGGSINGTTVGGTTAAAGKFTTLEATGVTTVQAGTVSDPAITTTGDTNTGIFFPAADTIAFAEGGTEAMRIDASGNVTIQTGILGFNSAAGVTTPTTNGQGYIGTYNIFGTTITGQGSAYDISFFNKNQGIAGYVATGATTITTSSDERLKENLEPITNALATINNLRTVTGNYKADPSRNVAFFIAQDMEQHFPQAFEGANPDAYGINYNWTNPLLAAAIKELKTIVDAQAARIAALENPSVEN